MKSMNWILFVLSLAAAAPVTAWDRDVPAALRPYMSAEEFRAAGLHKLNPAELAQFQAWFVRTVGERPAEPAAAARNRSPASGPRPAPPASPAADTDETGRFGMVTMPDELDEIVAVAPGTFAGWKTGTVFELDNGQSWKVVDSAAVTFIRPLTDPKVTIERGAFDTFRLRVEGYNRWANVRRIK